MRRRLWQWAHSRRAGAGARGQEHWRRVAVALVRVQVAPVDRTERALRALVPASNAMRTAGHALNELLLYCTIAVSASKRAAE